jgi:hypothetical protein
VLLCCDAHMLSASRVESSSIVQVMPILSRNVEANRAKLPRDCELSCQPYTWGEPLPFPTPPDVVIVSDAVYDPKGHAPLLASLRLLFDQQPTLTVFLAFEARDKKELPFFQAVRDQVRSSVRLFVQGARRGRVERSVDPPAFCGPLSCPRSTGRCTRCTETADRRRCL